MNSLKYFVAPGIKTNVARRRKKNQIHFYLGIFSAQSFKIFICHFFFLVGLVEVEFTLEILSPLSEAFDHLLQEFSFKTALVVSVLWNGVNSWCYTNLLALKNVYVSMFVLYRIGVLRKNIAGNFLTEVFCIILTLRQC